MTIHIALEGHECQHACGPLIPGLASCLGQNALTAREPQQADDRVETMCRPTGRCLHLLSHRRNRPPRCSMRRELVVPCFEIRRGPRMSSPRSQERSTRSGQRGETAAWLGGIVIALPDLVKGLGRRTAPHREGAVTSLMRAPVIPTCCLISLTLTLPPYVRHRVVTMDPRERATSCWHRVAGLVSREQKDLAVEIIEAEIRSAQHEVWLEASRLVLTGEPIEVARQLRQSGRYGPRARARSCHSGPRRKLESTIITNTSQMTNIPQSQNADVFMFVPVTPHRSSACAASRAARG